MKPEQKEKLIGLINNSRTLSEDRKAVILKAIDLLSDEKAETLIRIFEAARERYDQIEKKYEGATMELRKEYLEKANEFTSKEITDLFREWEIVENKKEEEELAKIEKEMENIPEE